MGCVLTSNMSRASRADIHDSSHDHCFFCIKTNCRLEGDVLGKYSCPREECPNKCGVRVHLCQMMSHLDICEKLLVDCFCGCPVQDIPRCQMRDHLKVCPAYQVVTDSGPVRRDEFQDYIQLPIALGGKVELCLGRCPLAQYGCSFTYKTIKPLKKNNTLVYDESSWMYTCMESNSHSSSENLKDTTKVSNDKKDPVSQRYSLSSLSLKNPIDVQENLFNYQCAQKLEVNHPKAMGIFDLSVEIFYLILSFLDSYSMHNLSKTCHLMRDICSTQLQKKGMLMSVWTQAEDKSWFISHQKWKFSGMGGQIKKWEHCGDIEVLNHLRKCPYNTDHNTSHRNEPVKLIGLHAAEHTS